MPAATSSSSRVPAHSVSLHPYAIKDFAGWFKEVQASLYSKRLQTMSGERPLRIDVAVYEGQGAPITLDKVAKSQTQHYNIISQQVFARLGSPSMEDASGDEDRPSDALGKIKLSWSYFNDAKSRIADFYVVSRVPNGRDAILSKTVSLNIANPSAYPTKIAQRTDKQNAQAQTTAQKRNDQVQQANSQSDSSASSRQTHSSSSTQKKSVPVQQASVKSHSSANSRHTYPDCTRSRKHTWE